MKLYHDLMDKFWEECEDSDEYLDLAQEYCIEHKEVGMFFHKKAEQECMHAEEVMQQIVSLWEKRKAKLEHESDKYKHGHYHFMVEHPKMVEELSELKLEIEITKKMFSSNPY